MTARRPPGSGQVEKLSSGRYRVRLVVAGQRRTFGPFDSPEEASDILDGLLDEISSGRAKPVGGSTLAAYGAAWLERKSAEGSRSTKTYAGGFENVKTAHFADWRMDSITRGDVKRWLSELTTHIGVRSGKPLARSTRRLALTTLTIVLDAAVDEARIPFNVARGIKLEKMAHTQEPWTYLTSEEQTKILGAESIPLGDRLLIQFAIGSGLRSGEQWALELVDVHVRGNNPHVVVRYGGPNHRPTKTGKIRKVPLFGLALDAITRWLKVLPELCPDNPKKIVFPGPNGEMRVRGRQLGKYQVDGKKLDRWQKYVADTVGRHVRWHDLRHTCGSSLVAGWWGRKWALLEVRDMLGHSSIKQTERYAHLAGTVLEMAAAQTLPDLPESKPTRSPRPPKRLWASGSDVVRATGRCTVVPVIPGTSAETKPMPGLDAQIRGILTDVAAGVAVDPSRLAGVSALIARERIESDPVLSAALAAVEPGPFQLERFLDAVRAMDTPMKTERSTRGPALP